MAVTRTQWQGKLLEIEAEQKAFGLPLQQSLKFFSSRNSKVINCIELESLCLPLPWRTVAVPLSAKGICILNSFASYSETEMDLWNVLGVRCCLLHLSDALLIFIWFLLSILPSVAKAAFSCSNKDPFDTQLLNSNESWGILRLADLQYMLAVDYF